MIMMAMVTSITMYTLSLHVLEPSFALLDPSQTSHTNQRGFISQIGSSERENSPKVNLVHAPYGKQHTEQPHMLVSWGFADCGSSLSRIYTLKTRPVNDFSLQASKGL